jgi:hypothetical protein
MSFAAELTPAIQRECLLKCGSGDKNWKVRSRAARPATALPPPPGAGIVAEQAADELRSAACGESEAKVLSERIMLQASARTARASVVTGAARSASGALPTRPRLVHCYNTARS